MWPFSIRGTNSSEADNLVDSETGLADSGEETERGYFQRLSESFSTLSGQNGETTEQEAAAAEDFDCFGLFGELSYQTRLYGFLFCFALGTFMSISSSFFVGFIVIKPSKFAIPWCLGNILSMGSSLFFVGPRRFCTTMFGETRRTASLVYLLSLIMTLFCALYLHSNILTFVFIFIQFASYLWLAASYIPYGRRILSGATSRVWGYFTS